MKTTALLAGLICFWNSALPQARPDSAKIVPIALPREGGILRHDFEAGDPWAAVPAGRRVFAGAPFEIRGVVELGGGWARRRERIRAGRIRIPVGRFAPWIHVVHAAGARVPEYRPVAVLRLRYEGGETRDFVIRYGERVRSFLKDESEPEGLSDPNSKIAWTNAAPAFSAAGSYLRLCESSFQNPLPNKRISSIEVFPLFNGAGYALAALSVGGPTAGASPGPKRPGDSWSSRRATVEVLSEESDPIAKARVRVDAQDSSAIYSFGEEITDAEGQAELVLPRSIVAVELTVNAPGYAAGLAQLTLNDDTSQNRVSIGLEKGETVGGIVQDGHGKAIAGAAVAIHAILNPWSGDAQVELDKAVTGPDGRWSSSAVPPRIYKLVLEVRRPDYMPAEFREEKGAMRPFGAGPNAFSPVSRDDLTAGRAILVLDPGESIEGMVGNEAGEPIRDAEVMLTMSPRPFARRGFRPMPMRRITATDAQGRFVFRQLPGGEGSLLARRSGYAPAQQPVNIAPGLGPVEFRLESADATFTGRIMDGTNAVADVMVRPILFDGVPLELPPLTTDAEGRFVLEHGPHGQVQFSLSKPGYQSGQSIGLGPSTNYPPFQISPLVELSGKVLDAEAGKPIPSFEIVEGVLWPVMNAGPADVDWAALPRFAAGEHGAYSVRFDFIPPFAKVRVMARADGYYPAATPAFGGRELRRYDFKLIKGKNISGVVFGPGHVPAPGADVAILGAARVTLVKGGLRGFGPMFAPAGGHFIGGPIQFGRQPPPRYRDKTDAEGRFELAPFLASSKIVAVHDSGMAEIDTALVMATHEIDLQPWGRIEGALRDGTQPLANELVQLTPGEPGPGRLNYDFEQFKKITDANGQFAFDHVPPGANRVAHVSARGQGGFSWSEQKVIDVVSGETLSVTLGGTGRPVIGKFVAPDPDFKPDWGGQSCALRSELPKSPRRVASAQELADWNHLPEIRKARARARSYTGCIQMDGSFRFANVEPGRYLLTLQWRRPLPMQRFPPAQPRARAVAPMEKVVVIEPIPGGVSDQPLDLGALPVRAGDPGKTGDGNLRNPNAAGMIQVIAP